MAYAQEFHKPIDTNLFWIRYGQLTTSMSEDVILAMEDAAKILGPHNIDIKDMRVITGKDPLWFDDVCQIFLGFASKDDLAMARLLLGP